MVVKWIIIGVKRIIIGEDGGAGGQNSGNGQNGDDGNSDDGHSDGGYARDRCDDNGAWPYWSLRAKKAKNHSCGGLKP